MGCAGKETNDLDDNDYTKNLVIRICKGQLIKNSIFTDTLIKSEKELDDKLRSFIPLKIKKENSEELTYNTKDDILTKSIKVDFEKQYITALNGINKIYNIKQANNNYIIYHDNQPSIKEKYIAIVVQKLEGEPRIILASPKRPFLN